MIFMAFYRNMAIPTKPEDIAFEEFLKELPADYYEMAYEFNAAPASDLGIMPSHAFTSM